jgi:hypothetical protein
MQVICIKNSSMDCHIASEPVTHLTINKCYQVIKKFTDHQGDFYLLLMIEVKKLSIMLIDLKIHEKKNLKGFLNIKNKTIKNEISKDELDLVEKFKMLLNKVMNLVK